MSNITFENCIFYSPTTKNFTKEGELIKEIQEVVASNQKTPTNSHYVFRSEDTGSRVELLFHASKPIGLPNTTKRQHDTESLGFSKGDIRRNFMVFSNQERHSKIANIIIFGIFCSILKDSTIAESFPYHVRREERFPEVLVDGHSLVISSINQLAPEKSARSLTALSYLFITSHEQSVHSVCLPPGKQINFKDEIEDYLFVLERQLARFKFAHSVPTWEGKLADFPIFRVNQIQEAVDALIVWKELGQLIGDSPNFSSIKSYDELLDFRQKFRGWIKEYQDELSHLKELTFDWTLSMTSLPEEIGELIEIRKLELSRNLCTTLPNSICDLKELEVLDVSYNRLVELPPSLDKLKKLRQLIAYSNKLTKVPDLSGLKELRELILFDNALTTSPKTPLATKVDLRFNNIPEAAKSTPKSFQSSDRSSIVHYDEGNSYVVRHLPSVESGEFIGTDSLGRTKEERKFLEQFESIFFAARYGNLSSCKELVSEGFRDFEAVYHGTGSNFSKKGKYDGKSPIQIARDYGHTEVVVFFEKVASAKP